MSCVFPRKVNATVGQLHAADRVMRPGRTVEVGSHKYDLGRIDGRACVDVDDVKPVKLQKGGGKIMSALQVST